MPLQSSTEYILKLVARKDISQIEEVRNFALLWNMFEGQLFDKCINKSKIDSMFNKISECIDEIVVNDTFIFFYERYVTAKDGERKFNGLYLERMLSARVNDSKKEQFVKDVKQTLKSNSCTKDTKVQIILYIIFRLRCNLFHGEKEARELYPQNEMFRVCNKFIIKCLMNKQYIKNKQKS